MIDFRLRRTRWLVGGLAVLTLVAVVIVIQSRACTVVVYNESETPREGVAVSAPGFQWRVPPLAGRESRQRKVPAAVGGGSFAVQLGRAGEPGQEIWFEPGPGRRLVVRVWRDGLVEADAQAAWWE